MEKMNKGPKACTTCAKAKARCIPRRSGEGDKCERCFRLDKECHSRAPAPPRARKQPKRSKVAELEKRLNELSSHLDSAPQRQLWEEEQDEDEDTAGPEVTSEINPVKQKPTLLPLLGHLFPKPEPGHSDAEASADAQTQWSPEALRPWDSPWPLPNEAGILLKHYEEQYEWLFPFVPVPKGLGPVELRHQRPFLWKAIMMVGCFFDGARQVRLGNELLADIGKAMVVDGLKSLDVLQGLQLLVAWFNYALKSTQLTNLLFLARSLCVELGSKNDALMLQDAEAVEPQSLDQLRAYVGTYYLNTMVFNTNKRMDVFMNTSHLDLCCQKLEAAKQYPSDEYLVKLVKIQQIAQSISLTMSYDPGQPAMHLPLTMVVQSFQEQLDSFKASLPPHLSEESTINAHIAIAEVLLREIGVSDQHCNSSKMPLTDRLQLLWSCTRSLRWFLSVRYAKADFEIPQFLCLSATDIAYTIITATRLLTMRLPGWNLNQILAELRLGDAIDHQIEDLHLTLLKRRCGVLPVTGTATMPLAPGEKAAEDPFERLQRLLKGVRELLRNEIETKKQPKMEGGEGTEMEPQGLGGDLDEDWWGELVNDTMWDVNGDVMGMGMF